MTAPAQVSPPAPARVGLTARQRDCFNAIERHIATFNHSPTSRELAKAMGLASLGRIHALLEALQERGWINFLPRRARSITIVPVAGYVLPPAVDARLRAHCAATGENPADVLADAAEDLLDDVEGAAAEIAA